MVVAFSLFPPFESPLPFDDERTPVDRCSTHAHTHTSRSYHATMSTPTTPRKARPLPGEFRPTNELERGSPLHSPLKTRRDYLQMQQGSGSTGAGGIGAPSPSKHRLASLSPARPAGDFLRRMDKVYGGEGAGTDAAAAGPPRHPRSSPQPPPVPHFRTTAVSPAVEPGTLQPSVQTTLPFSPRKAYPGGSGSSARSAPGSAGSEKHPMQSPGVARGGEKHALQSPMPPTHSSSISRRLFDTTPIPVDASIRASSAAAAAAGAAGTAALAAAAPSVAPAALKRKRSEPAEDAEAAATPVVPSSPSLAQSAPPAADAATADSAGTSAVGSSKRLKTRSSSGAAAAVKDEAAAQSPVATRATRASSRTSSIAKQRASSNGV